MRGHVPPEQPLRCVSQDDHADPRRTEPGEPPKPLSLRGVDGEGLPRREVAEKGELRVGRIALRPLAEPVGQSIRMLHVLVACAIMHHDGLRTIKQPTSDVGVSTARGSRATLAP